MIWSLTKVVAFLVLIAGLALLGGMLSDSGEALRISAGGMEFTLGPLQAVVLGVVLLVSVWLLLKVLGLVSATLHFLNGDETAISRFFDRNRERRGYAAMSEALVALASGEHAAAIQRARTAERLLKKPIEARILPGFEPDPSIKAEPIQMRSSAHQPRSPGRGDTGRRNAPRRPHSDSPKADAGHDARSASRNNGRRSRGPRPTANT